jgi:ureidoglycolate amidohydrolase
MIHQEQLAAELDTLASFSDAPAADVNRVVFSAADLKARAYVKGLCTAAGLTVREDAAGNTFARWTGLKPRRSARGVQSRRSIELVLFTSEEPTRYGLGCLGSRLLSGSLEPTRAALLTGVSRAAHRAGSRSSPFCGDPVTALKRMQSE